MNHQISLNSNKTINRNEGPQIVPEKFNSRIQFLETVFGEFFNLMKSHNVKPKFLFDSSIPKLYFPSPIAIFI